MKKILHITNWYPNKWNDLEAIFIKEQFNLFSKVSDASLIHIEVRYDKNKWFEFEKIKYSDSETGYYIKTKIKSFRLIELLTSYLLIKALNNSKYKEYDLLHFHIAYPLLTYFHLLKKIINKPIILSEHWSAFHYNFYLPKATKKLERIKNIFNQEIPIITVSKALLNDIQVFSGVNNFPSIIIPNVIDFDIYQYKNHMENSKSVFFIVNNWREIKNPYPMIEAFAELSLNGVDFELNIGGYGDLLTEMKSYVSRLELDRNINFLGKMNKEQISVKLNEASAYLISSKYETFSVVAAQSLSCGCPIIAPKIPAIQEYAGEFDMVCLKSNDSQGWKNALTEFISRKESFNRKQISKKAVEFLSHKKIQNSYIEFIS